MATLHHDIDKRRIYEVPENSSFTTDVDGYRIYVPNDIPSASDKVIFTNIDLWSRYVDYHFSTEYSTIPYDKSGGALRDVVDGVEFYAEFDLRFKNDWLFVPADYPHLLLIQGNVRQQFGTKTFFDKSRLTEVNVETEVDRAASLQTVIIKISGVEAEDLKKYITAMNFAS